MINTEVKVKILKVEKDHVWGELPGNPIHL